MSITAMKPSRLLRGQPRRIQGINSTFDDVRLVGRQLRADVGDAVVEPGVELERSIDTASTLTIPLHDPRGRLRQSRLLRRRFDVSVDDLWFRFTGARRDADQLTLLFEDREVAILRNQRGAVKVARDQVTRAQFLVGLILEARPRIPVYCPEFHTRQPIANERRAREDANERDLRRDFGIGAGARLTVKGRAATDAQLRMGDRVLRVALSLGAPFGAMVALISACIVEAELGNPSGGHGSSRGILQVTAPTAAAKRVDPMHVEQVVRVFLLEGFTGRGGAIAHARSGIEPGVSAQLAQGSAFPERYRQYAAEAAAWVREFLGGSETTTSSREVAKTYQFERRPGESTWDCAKRLGDEVNWRRFCSAGIVYYIAETDLLRSRARLVVRDGAPGIDRISWDWDQGKRVTEVRVSGRAKAWAAPPGAVAALVDQGPADGRYIVSSIRTTLGGRRAESVEVTLKRPTRPLPEPAPETRTVTVGGARQSEARSSSAIVIPSIRAGAPDWGGSYYVFDQFIDPFMRARGLQPGSRKRPNNTGSGTSDHWVGALLSFATDYPTFVGEAAARALAAALGNPGWQANSYASWDIRIGGHTFRVQILWGSRINHGDHVHVGLRRL